MCGRRSTSWRPPRTGASNEFPTSAVGALHRRGSRDRYRCSPSWCSRRCSSAPSTHARAARPVPAGNGAWLATAYGPPWGGIQGDGVTATGINLTAGPPMLEVAVDPSVIPLRSFVHVKPNPFDTSGAFYAGDTGGAISGPARGHLRLARARRPGRVGEQAGHRHAGGRSRRRQRPRAGAGAGAASAEQPMCVGGRLPEPVRARDGDRARADRHGCRLHARAAQSTHWAMGSSPTRRPRAPGGGRTPARAATAARWCTDSPTAPIRAASCT